MIKAKNLPLKSEVQQRSKQIGSKGYTNSDDSSTDMADGSAEFTHHTEHREAGGY
jgi:hypothetical protein